MLTSVLEQFHVTWSSLWNTRTVSRLVGGEKLLICGRTLPFWQDSIYSNGGLKLQILARSTIHKKQHPKRARNEGENVKKNPSSLIGRKPHFEFQKLRTVIPNIQPFFFYIQLPHPPCQQLMEGSVLKISSRSMASNFSIRKWINIYQNKRKRKMPCTPPPSSHKNL